MRDNDTQASRRDVLRAAGAAGAASVAGFPALAGGQEGTETTAGGGPDISGVTMPYWTWYPSQSEYADGKVRELVGQFENEHDLTVQPNYTSFGDIAGGKWRQNIAGGVRPAIYNSNNFLSGQFIEPGWVKPADDYLGTFDQATRDDMEWSLELAQNVYRGYDDVDVYEVPTAICLSRPFVARMDHFEEAGLDPEEDFPPTSYEHLVQVATQLQEDGPADYGYQVFGDQGDITDETLAMWTTAEGGADGLYLTPDWTDVNLDNEVWKEWFRKYVAIFREHELSHPNTPAMSDEQTAQLLIDGQVSMMQNNALNHGIFLSRAPEMIENGTIAYGPMWKGAADNRGAYFIYAAGIMTASQGANQGDWERKQAAGQQFIEFMLSKPFQRELHRFTGGGPVRQSVWEDIRGQNHRLGETMIQTAEDTIPEVGWGSHPQQLTAVFGDTPPLMQNAIRGQISPDEALDRAAERARQQIDFFDEG